MGLRVLTSEFAVMLSKSVGKKSWKEKEYKRVKILKTEVDSITRRSIYRDILIKRSSYFGFICLIVDSLCFKFVFYGLFMNKYIIVLLEIHIKRKFTNKTSKSQNWKDAV